jgi:hypothetical protein
VLRSINLQALSQARKTRSPLSSEALDGRQPEREQPWHSDETELDAERRQQREDEDGVGQVIAVTDFFYSVHIPYCGFGLGSTYFRFNAG